MTIIPLAFGLFIVGLIFIFWLLGNADRFCRWRFGRY